MKTKKNEPSPDNVIADLHRIRERIVDSFGGDLVALTADARRRQATSGREVASPGRGANQHLPQQRGNRN